MVLVGPRGRSIHPLVYLSALPYASLLFTQRPLRSTAQNCPPTIRPLSPSHPHQHHHRRRTGKVDIPIFFQMTAGGSGEDNKSTLDAQPSNPAGRFGFDSDMAASILFLAGPGGVFYNEQVLCPDGGSTLVNPSVK